MRRIGPDALGQGDLTPIEQASTFATLIDGGIYRAPHVISKLSQWTPSGQQLVHASDRDPRRS